MIRSLCAALCVALAFPVAAKDAAPLMPEGYSLESIALPEGIRFEVGGLDINAAGDVAVSTRIGDVWILPAGQSDWRLFAEGLGEPLGVLWEADGSILVAHKPELTRLRDTDGDGKADLFENVANGFSFNENYHEFHFGPVRDQAGNLYGSLNLASGEVGTLYSWRGITKMTAGERYRGWAYEVTPEGEFIPFAAGFRTPAGISLSPKDELFITDNQGDWVPTSSLFHVRKGRFYGHPGGLISHPDYDPAKIDALEPEDFAAMMDPPAVFIPHEELANSPGNPVWDVTGGKFGPFEGQIFVPEYKKSLVFRVMLEEVGGEYQGAAIKFLAGLASGAIRADFDPSGRLWVGQTSRGWPTAGPEPFAVQRIAWDGHTVPFELQKITLTKKGFDLTFTQPLSEASAADFEAQQWHYHHWATYGSPKVEQASVAISKMRLSEDRRTVSLSMQLTPGNVVAIDFSKLRNAQGKAPGATMVYYTLNKLRD